MHHIVKHPLLEHKMTVLRNIDTETKEFRNLSSEITMLLTYEALKNLHTYDISIETPVAPMTGKHILEKVIIVPILRAGVGMLEGMLKLIPDAKVGFIGIYRDHNTKEPIEYYEKLPENVKDARIVIVDPMLATGGSIIATIDLIKKRGYKKIKIITILSSPEGIEAVEKAHDDVEIYTGALDKCLNEKKYIVPGLGDAGDRLFGTK